MKTKLYLFSIFIGIAIFENKFLRSFLEDEMKFDKDSALSNNLIKSSDTMTSEMPKYIFSHIASITPRDKTKSPKERILNDLYPYRKHNYYYQNDLYSQNNNASPHRYKQRLLFFKKIKNKAKKVKKKAKKIFKKAKPGLKFIKSKWLKNKSKSLNRVPSANRDMFTSIIESNKYICLDKNSQKKKICAGRCQNSRRRVCRNCMRMFVNTARSYCRRARLNRNDRSLYNLFKNNGKNCLFKETICQKKCDRYCRKAHKKPRLCFDCLKGCPKAAAAGCFSGPQLLAEYNSGKGILRNTIDTFGLRPLLCINKNLSCNNICHRKCRKNSRSRACISCKKSCKRESRTGCKYVRFDGGLKRLINRLSNNKSNCSKDEIFCKKSCHKHCSRNKFSIQCKQCNVRCYAVFGIACTRPSEFKKRYLNKANSKVFNYYYYGIFKLFKAKCSNINLACNEHCGMPCMFGNDKKQCSSCKKTCRNSAAASCRNVSNDPLTTKLFNSFYKHPARCNHIKHLCIGECRKQHCKGSKIFSSGCRKCITICHNAGHAACDISRHKITRMNTLFNDLKKYFEKKKSTMSCNHCYSERDLICNWKCGHNYKCSKDCKSIGLKACLSVCKGNYSTYYNKIFNSKFQREFRSHKLQCNLCATECSKKCQIRCNRNDHRCKRLCNSICKRSCMSINCKGKNNSEAKSRFSKANAEKYFKKRLDVELKRFKTAEDARIEYDERIEHKKRFKVFRNNREKLLSTIEIGEGAIYEEQKKITNSHTKKAVDYETNLMEKIRELYSNKDDYDNKKTLELAIFED